MLVLILVGVAVMAIMNGGEAPARSAPEIQVARVGAAATDYTPVRSPAVFAGIGDRSSDARPLTERELFADAGRAIIDPDAGARLTLRAKRVDQDCLRAIWGVHAAESLLAAGCNQAARAMYTDSAKRYAASVTIFNLKDVAGAHSLIEQFDSRQRGGFVLPLETKPAVDGFGDGSGVARGMAMGHYVVVAWVQRTGGWQPDQPLLSLLIKAGEAPAVLGRAAAHTGETGDAGDSAARP